MPGIFALAGGDEFRPAYDIPDRVLLALLSFDSGPIVVLPTAAAHEEPEQAMNNGLRHFRRLASRVPIHGLLVVDTQTANDAEMAARIASAGMVYLTGGDPWYLLETLRESAALEAIKAVARRGGIVAGSSAGAMALCAWMRGRDEGWQEGLGLVPGVAVLPHHGERPAALGATRRWLPPEVVVLGVPVGSLCIRLHELAAGQSEWRIVGSRPVTIYRAEEVKQAREGETFVL